MNYSPQERSEENLVFVQSGDTTLEGNLTTPEGATGMVLFAHGSGSSRHSPRNRFVAQALNEATLGTLLIDLLTSKEEEIDMVTRQLRFDINLLVRRLVGVIDWLDQNQSTSSLNIGLFGASTGAAAALVAAAQRPLAAKAVVSRGGRPDLAGQALVDVQAPTLLIVGGYDTQVIKLNQQAFHLLDVPKKLEIVPRATHLFEEPGALEKVSQLARDWFKKYLSA